MNEHLKRDAVEVLYGTSGLHILLPPETRATVIGKRPLQKIADPQAAVRAALARPVAAAPYDALIRGRKSACILICDITRPVPNHLFLRPLIEGLLAAGMDRERITVLVATGLHRPNEGAELDALVGDPWVRETVRVENHFARDDAAHGDLGTTSRRRTPVKLDRRFVDADLRIATGLVEPHFMAGYSGGRKVIAPGVAHEDTIRTFHSARFMEDPAAIQCNLAGNPLHEEQLEIVRMLGDVYAVNTVIDEERALVHVNFGEVIASHLAAVEFVAESVRVPVGRRFATVLTSAAGDPLDKTYYQTVKGMVTPLDILEPGGTLIIASACSEGFGSVEFRAAQERLVNLGPDAFLQTLVAKRFADVDEWQTEMQLKSMRVGRVLLYTTGLDADSNVSPAYRPSARSRMRSRRRSRTPAIPRSPSFPKDPMSSQSLPEALPAPASLAIHLDLVGGLSGDMFVAAMIDALPALAEPLLAELAAVQPAGAAEPAFVTATSGGLRARRFGLATPITPSHAHAGTPYVALRQRIADAPLSAPTRTHALALLALLADAEAHVHGISVDAVHFHELADWDSLLDIVAAGYIAAKLEGAHWSASAPPLGNGIVRTEHGLLPVPAPATSRLLEGSPWHDDGIGGERVTPTGAAILRHLVPATTCATRRESGRLIATGCGAGTRELAGVANIVRALVFERSASAASDAVTVLEFDVDDMTGEEIAGAADHLRSVAGVIDV